MPGEQPSDPNIMPEFNLGITARNVAKSFIGLCSYFPPVGYHSDHERGAAAMLDAALCPDEVDPPLEAYAEVADSFLEQAADKERRAQHYADMAEEAGRGTV